MSKSRDCPPLTVEQTEIIIGSLLGDGCIMGAQQGCNGRFRKSQCSANEEYIRWHFDKLLPYSNGVSLSNRPAIKNIGGKIVVDRDANCCPQHCFYTCNHPVFKELRRKWYPNGKKIIPCDLRLTPLTMAIWFCDDGSNTSRNKEAVLCTQCFTVDEIEFLIRLLKDFDILAGKRKVRNEKHEIRISNYSYLDFINIIKPHVTWSCFQYKVDLAEFVESPRLTIHEIREIRSKLRSGNRISEIAREYEVSQASVYDIKAGRCWAWVD